MLAATCVPGCFSPADRQPAEQESAKPKQRVPIRVLVADSPGLASAIQRQWQARADTEVKITETSAQKIAWSQSKRLGADVVIYPSGLMGELAQRELIVSLSSEDLREPRFAREDIFRLLRLREMRWGEQVNAVPFGSPVLTLYYREDRLQELGLETPETWSDYMEVARALSQEGAAGEAEGSEGAWSAVAEPWGPGWAGQVLLARAASYATHRSQFSTLFDLRTMQPLIDTPPFIKALEELVATAEFAPSEANSFSPDDTRQAFWAGQCAMALSWPSSAANVEPAAEVMGKVSFAELPGAPQSYNFRLEQWEDRGEDEDPRVTLLGVEGRLGSVTRECRRTHVALNLLFWLSGQELSSQIAPQSEHTTLFRRSHVGQAAVWVEPELGAEAAERYAEVTESALSRPDWLSTIRIPGRRQYLDALDEAVHAALSGEAEPGEALQNTARRWAEITEAQGLDEQRRAYTRSVGLEP